MRGSLDEAIIGERLVPNGALVAQVRVLCGVFDKKAGELHGPVFLVRTVGEAIRLFSDVVNGEGQQASLLALHPEDFSLVELARVDVGTCDVQGEYRLLIEAEEVKR